MEYPTHYPGASVSPAQLAQLRALYEEHGESATAELLGLHRHTLTRLLAGLSVRPGTLALLELSLAREMAL